MQQSTSGLGNQSKKKRLSTQMKKDRKMNQYFWFPKVVEEINLLKKFSNPHIIRFIEAFENPGQVIHMYVIQHIHPKNNFLL